METGSWLIADRHHANLWIMEPHREHAASEVLHQRGWRKAFTVAEMIDKWARLVAEVEDGYHDMVEEYTNDLYSRNWLHEAWPLLTEDVITT